MYPCEENPAVRQRVRNWIANRSKIFKPSNAGLLVLDSVPLSPQEDVHAQVEKICKEAVHERRAVWRLKWDYDIVKDAPVDELQGDQDSEPGDGNGAKMEMEPQLMSDDGSLTQSEPVHYDASDEEDSIHSLSSASLVDHMQNAIDIHVAENDPSTPEQQ